MTLGPPAAPERGAPAIDRSVLGEWLADDDAAIDALLVVFRDSIRAEQAKLRDTLATGDLTEYASAAHRLRGAALSMGARALAETAAVLYAAARASDAAACDRAMATLADQVNLMVAEVPVGSGRRNNEIP
jgi:HPt (histidine-containing phosphotransfer) domain-containing protein